jgi:hypothetical protein
MSPESSRIRARFLRGAIVQHVPAAVAVAGAILLLVQWGWGCMLWVDEEMIAINIRDRSFAELAGALSLAQAAPYAWLVAERALLLALGSGERVLRLVPVLFGVATLGGAVWVGRRWMNLVGATSLVFLCAMGQWIAFHALELKHYSADVCFGLLLPALAAWAVETPTTDVPMRRIALWWIAAALAQWTSNGALFVAPACAIVIVATMTVRFGWRGAMLAVLPGLIWAGSFGANYLVTLRPALGNDFLRNYWASALPPAGASLAQALTWCARQLAPLAEKPGGSGFGLVFWAAAVVGFFASPGFPRAFRAAYALVPLSAFLLAIVRLVPMSERLGLWFVPALYVGIAMAAQAAADLLVRSAASGRQWRAAVGAVAILVLALMGRDIFARGTIYVRLEPYDSNHEFDDRAAVGWLARQRRPGDVWMANYLALPAVWWYRGDDDGLPIVEASLDDDRAACGSREIAPWRADGQPQRALVYLGFGADSPRAFVETLVSRLTTVGSVTAYRMFQAGHAFVIDLKHPSSRPLSIQMLTNPTVPAAEPRESGCISIAPARFW